MEETVKRWGETLGLGSALSGSTMSTWTTTGTTTTGEVYITPPMTSEYISMSTVLADEKWIGTTAEDKPEPVKPAKPVKRYSKKNFKKKLKELCG